MRLFSSLLLIMLTGAAAMAQYSPANAEWNQPREPFRVAGNVYYVGATSVSAYLITTPKGHILIDTGFHETAAQVERNIRTLGFKLEDVKILLISHSHYDHAGAIAELRAKTHARFLVNPADAKQMARGGKGDFHYADTFTFPPAQPDGVLRDGKPVRLGGVSLTPVFTPGHTKGCTSWLTTVNEAGRALQVVIPCSLTAPEYELVKNDKYPNILSDYERSIARLKSTPCDVFLALHSWDFGLAEKTAGQKPGQNPFIDPEGYRNWLNKSEANLHAQAARQRAK